MSLLQTNAITLGDFALREDAAECWHLAPTIHRQRLVVEGYPTFVPAAVVEFTEQYLRTTDITAKGF